MARTRKYVDEERILAGMRAGKTGEQILAALAAEGWNVSKATVVRRMRELVPRLHAERAVAPAAAESGEVPDDEAMLDGSSLEQVDRWIGQTARAVDKAEAAGDLALMSNLMRTADALAKTRAKLAPVLPPDPDAHPDMIAAAKRAREALHRLVDSATEAS